jgi:hypothetical protein
MKHSRSLLICMNLNEAVELLRVVSAIPVSDSSKHPEIRIVHAIGEVNAEGYTLRVEKNLVDADYQNHLNRIAESNKLAIRESKRYLILYSR